MRTFVVLAVLTICAPAFAKDKIKWENKYDLAKAMSQVSDKPLVVYYMVGGDGGC